MDLFTFDVTPFVSVLATLVPARRSGNLTVVWPEGRITLLWSYGELVMAVPERDNSSFASYLVRKGVVSEDDAKQLRPSDPVELVPLLLDKSPVEIPQKQQLLREWLGFVTLPLFNVTEGTAIFDEQEAIDPERRIFIQSMPAFITTGVRSMSNGLSIRKALGDLKREVVLALEPPFALTTVPLTDAERPVAAGLAHPLVLESFLRHSGADSVTTARVVITLLALGLVQTAEDRTPDMFQADTTAQDVALLASIGASDSRSLRAAAFSRQMSKMNYYEILHVPRMAVRSLIVSRVEELKGAYDPSTYPPALHESLREINKRINEAASMLKDPGRRAEYDRLLARADTDDLSVSIETRMNRRNLAEQNYRRAKELAGDGDYWGAIVLLRQTVGFSPDHASAWYLLGSCQQHNPKWTRSAIESVHRALSIEPNHIDAIITLGDLYKMQGLTSRAQSCYEDALQINPENPEAKKRLKGIKK